MATYVTYTFPEHNSGDTFPGVAFTATLNDEAMSLVGAIIKMYVSDKVYSTILIILLMYYLSVTLPRLDLCLLT